MKCKGCGAEIQHEDETLPGYIPKEVFERRTLAGEEILCQRCFRARHYGKLMPVRLEDFWTQLTNVIKEVDVVVWILDITDFEGSYDPKIFEVLSSVKKILVVNKIDLLPRAVTVQEIDSWVRRQVLDEPFDVILTSATKRYGLRRLKEKLLEFRRVLFVGVTNVGKSSLFKEITGKDVSVTPFPGTTLGLIRAKLFNTILFDSPGITTKHRLIDFLSPESTKKTHPRRSSEQIHVQTRQEQCHFSWGSLQAGYRLQIGAETYFSDLCERGCEVPPDQQSQGRYALEKTVWETPCSPIRSTGVANRELELSRKEVRAGRFRGAGDCRFGLVERSSRSV